MTSGYRGPSRYPIARRRLLHIFVGLVLMFCSNLSEAQTDESDWRKLETSSGVEPALLGARSPVMTHEHPVTPGKPWQLGSISLTFDVQGDRLDVTAVDGDDQPVAVAVSQGRPAAVMLRAFDLDYSLSVRRGHDDKTLLVASLYALPVPIGSQNAWLVDSDLDGRLGSMGDGLIVPGSRTVGPWPQDGGEVWSRSRGLLLKHRADGTWWTAPLDGPRRTELAHAAAWRSWMWQRQAAGLLPLRYVPDAEADMLRHTAYLHANAKYQHHQSPGDPHYSAQGARAGMTSVIGGGKTSYLQAVQDQLSTLFHRSSCLAPELTASAMVLDRGIFMASTKRYVGGPLAGQPLVYPPHGMTDVPRGFNIASEVPAPFDGQQHDNRRGTAVAVRLPQLLHATTLPQPPVFTLHERQADGKRELVPCSLYYPGQTPRTRSASRSYAGHIALIPGQYLKPGTVYEASIDVQFTPTGRGNSKSQRFVYAWHFTTQGASASN